MNPSLLKTYAFFKTVTENSGELFLVGGSVRDALLGKTIKDLDLIARGIEIDALIVLLKKHGRLNLVGKSFGVIKFRPTENPNLELDIALPRTEVSTGAGHKDFSIQSDPFLPIETDLQRRDFTINALAQNLQTNELLDPFHGQNDLQNKIIRTVFKNSFVEDPLRLLRAVQFAARFGFTIEENTLAEMKQHAALIKTVAKERIIDEIRKLLTAPKPSLGFHIMRDVGLLRFVFPDVANMIGVTQPQKNNEDVYTHTMKVLDAARSATELEKPGDLEIMFSALFHDAGKPKTRREDAEDPQAVTFYNHQLISTGIAWHWLKEYRATTIGVNPHHICHLVKNHMFETKEFHNERALRRFISKVGKESVFDLLDLRLADKKGGRYPNKVYGIMQLRDRIRAEINRKPPFTAKDLALNGFDIMNLGIPAGPGLGRVQKFLMTRVIDDPTLNTKEELTKMIEDNKKDFIGSNSENKSWNEEDFVSAVTDAMAEQEKDDPKFKRLHARHTPEYKNVSQLIQKLMLAKDETQETQITEEIHSHGENALYPLLDFVLHFKEGWRKASKESLKS